MDAINQRPSLCRARFRRRGDRVVPPSVGRPSRNQCRRCHAVGSCCHRMGWSTRVYSVWQVRRLSINHRLVAVLVLGQPGIGHRIVTWCCDKAPPSSPRSLKRRGAGLRKTRLVFLYEVAVEVMLVARRKTAEAARFGITLPLLVWCPAYGLHLVLRKLAVCHRELYVAKMLYRRDDE